MLDLSLMSNISLEIGTRYFSGDQQRTGVTVLDHFQMFLTFLFQYTLTTGAGDDHYQNLHSHVAMTSIQTDAEVGPNIAYGASIFEQYHSDDCELCPFLQRMHDYFAVLRNNFVLLKHIFSVIELFHPHHTVTQ
jgi:hypothetical protein